MAAPRRSMVDRIWSALGFGACSSPDPWPEQMDGFVPSYLGVTTIMVFGLTDRLRILLSGKVMAQVSIKTDVLVMRSLTATSVSVLPGHYPVLAEKEIARAEATP